MKRIKTFLVGSTDIEKWMHQNKAVYTGSYYEGCLLDNFLVMTKRGTAAIYEHYLNSNSSCYRVEFSPGVNDEIISRFIENEENALAQLEE